MPTALGPGSGSQIVVNVYNDHTSDIPKGNVVELAVTAIASADGLTEDKYLSVYLAGLEGDNHKDSDEAAGGIHLGVAKEDIPAKTVGEIVMWGLAQCVMGDTAAVGEVVGVDGTAGEMFQTVDATSADWQAPHGIQLETGVDGDLKWVFVDFLSSRFGGNSTADGITDVYHGIAY